MEGLVVPAVEARAELGLLGLLGVGGWGAVVEVDGECGVFDGLEVVTVVRAGLKEVVADLKDKQG